MFVNYVNIIRNIFFKKHLQRPKHVGGYAVYTKISIYIYIYILVDLVSPSKPIFTLVLLLVSPVILGYRSGRIMGIVLY